MAVKSGDPCPQCKAGKLLVASSQRSGDYQTRYLRCVRCGCTDKQIVSATEIRRKVFYCPAS
ncbi:MAG: hypothetical protein FJ284_03520 [Planctomycetes bacterium]|nr:hypothetical protein [Planctomycetota bacterium]